jgi:hypothetical protein
MSIFDFMSKGFFQDSGQQQQPKGQLDQQGQQGTGQPTQQAPQEQSSQFQQNQEAKEKNYDNVADPKAGLTSSPFDEFAPLFDNKKANQQPPSDNLFSFDDQKIKDTLSTMSFASIKEADVTKALQGDMSAFAGVLDQVARNVMFQTMKLNSQMIESGVKKSLGSFEESLPDKFRQFQSSSTVMEDKYYNHPAIKPVIKVLTDQFSKSFPDASPAELRDMVKKYLKLAAGAEEENQPNQQQQQPNQQSNVPPPSDFSDFFNMG